MYAGYFVNHEWMNENFLLCTRNSAKLWGHKCKPEKDNSYRAMMVKKEGFGQGSQREKWSDECHISLFSVHNCEPLILRCLPITVKPQIGPGLRADSRPSCTLLDSKQTCSFCRIFPGVWRRAGQWTPRRQQPSSASATTCCSFLDYGQTECSLGMMPLFTMGPSLLVSPYVSAYSIHETWWGKVSGVLESTLTDLGQPITTLFSGSFLHLRNQQTQQFRNRFIVLLIVWP